MQTQQKQVITANDRFNYGGRLYVRAGTVTLYVSTHFYMFEIDLQYASLLSDLGVYALHPGAEAAPAVLLEALVDVGAVEAVAGVARGAGAALEGTGGVDALEGV